MNRMDGMQSLLRRSAARSCCLLVPVLLAPVSAQDVQGFDSRIRDAESIVARFYRGESLEEARKRVNLQVDAFNERVNQWNTRLDRAKREAGREAAPLDELESQVAALDKQLALKPDPRDQESLQRYNHRVQERNALVERYNALIDRARAAADAYEALGQQSRGELQRVREGLQREQRSLEERAAAMESFQKEGRDVAFFQGLNRLLADLRQQQRLRPWGELQRQVQQVRGLRLELARWAMAQQAAQENGLVLVEAQVGDETCCFLVDTGAQRVCISTEIIVALGCQKLLGEESTLILAGGQKIRGRQIEIPAITVDGQTESSVAGSAIPVSEVGVDGLLGQSFLQRFVYTIDSRSAKPLKLVRR